MGNQFNVPGRESVTTYSYVDTVLLLIHCFSADAPIDEEDEYNNSIETTKSTFEQDVEGCQGTGTGGWEKNTAPVITAVVQKLRGPSS